MSTLSNFCFFISSISSCFRMAWFSGELSLMKEAVLVLLADLEKDDIFISLRLDTGVTIFFDFIFFTMLTRPVEVSSSSRYVLSTWTVKPPML